MQSLPGFRDFLPQIAPSGTTSSRNGEPRRGATAFVEYDGPLLEDLELFKKKSAKKSRSSFTTSSIKAAALSRCDPR
jgi:hypothetical protein